MKENSVIESQIIEEEIEEIVETETQIIEEEIDEPIVENEAVANEICIGVVSDCDRLNVRKTPSRNALVVAEIDVDTEVMIDLDNSTAGWYNICTATGVEGFCMKDFITVNK